MAAASLALTRDLLRWLQADAAWAGLPTAQRAALQWTATFGSINARLGKLNTHTPVTVQAPLLVLGPWRSGTTVMHELLAAATGLIAPRTWQCMNAATFTALPAQRRAAAAVARPMDGLRISAVSPQEDEFALLTLGADSAYRAFWMPHRLPELHATLQQQHWLKDERWMALWTQFLGGVLRSTAQAQQPLLLKSPNHSFRLQAILKRFPQTRVVWMLRDGAAVYHSNVKMWQQMFAQHGLTAPWAGALDEFLAAALQACAVTMINVLPGMAANRCMCVPQAQLRADGAAVLHAVHAKLQLPGPLDYAALQSALARTALGRQDHYSCDVPETVAAAVADFDAAQAQALKTSWAL
jgi:omega-hydroxy-beta-dihydromenaquinone-9 sulfotransferase